MKPVPFLLAAVLVLSLLPSSPVWAADKRVFRIDSLIASQKGGKIELKAKGAVPTGGWSHPRLHLVHNDGRVLTMEFLATPPPSDMTVIDAVVPVTASTEIKGHAASVHVLADQNEVTSEIPR